MRNHGILKQEFLKKWMMGLKLCSSSKKGMSILERTNAIKLSSDLAMASTRKGTACWSRTVISDASKDESNKNLVENILGRGVGETRANKASNICMFNRRRIRSKKILKRSHRVCHRVRKEISSQPKVIANSTAKRLIQKRIELLKTVVPGGEFIEDELSLIEETLDYVTSLQAQVDVMRCFAAATEFFNPK